MTKVRLKPARSLPGPDTRLGPEAGRPDAYTTDSLLFDDDERGPQSQSLRLKLEAVDQFTPDEQEHVAAFIEGALLRHHARQAFSGQAS